MNVNRRISFVPLAAVLVVGCSSSPSTPSATNTHTASTNQPSSTLNVKGPFDMSGGKTLASGLIIKDAEPAPKGTEGVKYLTAETGDEAEMEYTGELADGTIFDSNMPDPNGTASKPPFSFAIGAGQVIKGWDQGIVGLHVGQTRYLEIPASLGYGDKGSPPKIPANATLFFKVKLLGLVKAGQSTVFDTKDLKVGTGKPAEKNDMVTIAFTGKLLNGEVFNTVTKDNPLRFQVETGAIDSKSHIGVTGLAYAVEGMKVGGERLITLPPAVGFVPGAAPEGIGQNQILQFDVTLLKVEPPTALGK